MATYLEDHYPTRLQGIRRQGGTVQVYANIPLPLASALDLEAGETVTWKVVVSPASKSRAEAKGRGMLA